MIDPCPEEWVLKPPKGEMDICTVLRSIYHITDEPEIRLKIRIATAMAKNMDMKLREYKKLFFMGNL